MMKLPYYKALILLLSLFPLVTIAQNVQQKKPGSAELPTSNLLTSKIDKQLDSILLPHLGGPNTVGLSIGILKDGKSYTYGYGTTQKNEAKLPDANTIFEIGSITKTFTASILAWYVNQGKISLTDPITKYLPDSVAVNPELQKITLLNLSNHTSGLPRLPGNLIHKDIDGANPYKGYTKQMLFADLRVTKLKIVPGEVYAYSNLGMGLLGTILEKISGKTYETLVKEIITKPLKMTRTFQRLTLGLSGDFVKVYGPDAVEAKAWDFDALAGCGALKSTVNDLLIYAKNNITTGDAGLSKAFQLSQEVTFSKEARIALGWHLLQAGGEVYYWHNGGTGGSRSFLAFNIKKKTAIVLLFNSLAEPDGVALEILQTIFK